MKLILNTGTDLYRGWDRGTNKQLVIGAGELATVSDEEAAALLADFPERFEDLGCSPHMHAPVVAENVIEPETEILPVIRKPARVARQKVKSA